MRTPSSVTSRRASPASGSGVRPRARSSRRSATTTCRTRASATSPPATSRSRTCTCFAARVTYVGELGWELYPSTEFAVRLWDRLDRGRRAARPAARRLSGDRLAPAREGVPVVGRRHHPRRLAARGRPRLRGGVRQGRELPGARGGATAPRRRRHPAPPMPDARGCSLVHPRERAGARRRRDRRAGHVGRDRLRASRRASRSRTFPTGSTRSARRSRSRCSGNGSTPRSSQDTLWDPSGERIKA